jgi:hypothetical protein
MNFGKLLAGLLLSALSLGLPAAEPETKKPASKTKADGRGRVQAERTCALTLTWWEMPVLAEGETMELGVQGDLGVTPINPPTMNASGTILYEGPGTVAIVRKTLVPNPSGKPGAKPVEGWVPFTSFPLGAADREVLGIMFPSPGNVLVRPFNIDVETFPFGGFHVYNYAKSRLICSMANKTFTAEPSARAISPLVMTKREVVNFYLGLPEAEGKLRILYRAPLILSEKMRRLYFVLEKPTEDEDDRFVTHTLMIHVSGHKTIEVLRNGQTASKGPIPQESVGASSGPPEGQAPPPVK